MGPFGLEACLWAGDGVVELLEGHGRRFSSELLGGICPFLLWLPWCYAAFPWFILLARGSRDEDSVLPVLRGLPEDFTPRS